MKSTRYWRLAALLGALLLIGMAAFLALGRRQPDKDGGTAEAPAHAGVNPPSGGAPAAPLITHLSHGRFADLRVYAPAATPGSFVLLLGGAAGGGETKPDLAEVLARQGALVAAIDLPQLQKSLEADGGDCVFPDGDLENLSHFVQAYQHLPSYLAPILVGEDAGAAFAYAMLAQAPPDTFAAALSVNFSPQLEQRMALCRGSGVEFRRRADGRGVDLLPVPKLSGAWMVLQGQMNTIFPLASLRDFQARVPGAQLSVVTGAANEAVTVSLGLPQFSAAFAQLAGARRAQTPAPPAALGGLPVIEIPAQGGGGTDFAIILSGDGGWAGLDRDVAAALVAKGIPVVGLDSLRYFWSARTPQGLADDLDRMIRYYLARLGKQRVLLIGYSQGADVLPFAVNRLPPATRATVALTAVIGLSPHALFEFHLTNWLADDRSGAATAPEISRISGTPVLCIYGKEEDDSVCPQLDPSKVHVVQMPGGHHFNGDYAGLARQILNQAHPSRH